MTSSEKERKRAEKKLGIEKATPKNKMEIVYDKETGKAIGKKDAQGNVVLYKKRGRAPLADKNTPKNLSKKQTGMTPKKGDNEMGIEDLLADEVRRKEKKASTKKDKVRSSSSASESE